jgi:hypothetical protein
LIDCGVVTRRWFSRVGLTIVVGILMVGCADQKGSSAFEEAFNDDTKTWKEIETQLPAKPNDADLVDFAVSGATGYHFGIDRKSLTIGSDGVFRYTLVATSPSGVRNVSYEGIHCQVAQKKTYAIGRADGTWVRARNSAWTQIEDVYLNRQHAALMKEYFCPESYPARSVDEIIARLKVRFVPQNL